jgi:hypothetical protein
MQTLAPSRSTHRPTQELIDALRVRGWRLSGIDFNVATLRHPRTGRTIAIHADVNEPTRIRWASIDGVPSTIHRTIQIIREG